MRFGFDQLGSFAQAHRAQFPDYLPHLVLGRATILLGVNGFEHARHFRDLSLWHVREHVSVEVHDAPLPLCVGEELCCRFHQAQARVRNDQLHAGQAAVLQMTQEASPALQILLLAFGDSENLSMTIGADADRHQHRDVSHFTGPAAFEHHAVQKQIRELAFDRAVAPGLDVGVDLLVQAGHRP